ncbi:MAG: homoserine dehydrogenase, partial [Gammaproteobacteria bacterium]|nr:homoserine dehydrogenase [Gammaproteobacteria bacterium]
MKNVRLALVGVGNVGRRLLELISERKNWLRRDYELEFSVHCVVDSSGVAVNERGFDVAALAEYKQRGAALADLPEYRNDESLADALDDAPCDILIEASPLNLESGDPGLANSRTALQRRMHLVLANKSPLALAHAELLKLAEANDVGMLYSATFCGGLPVLNIIRRDMVCGKVLRFRGIFNGTTNFILQEMLDGHAYGRALRQAREIGAAEADSS